METHPHPFRHWPMVAVLLAVMIAATALADKSPQRSQKTRSEETPPAARQHEQSSRPAPAARPAPVRSPAQPAPARKPASPPARDNAPATATAAPRRAPAPAAPPTVAAGSSGRDAASQMAARTRRPVPARPKYHTVRTVSTAATQRRTPETASKPATPTAVTRAVTVTPKTAPTIATSTVTGDVRKTVPVIRRSVGQPSKTVARTTPVGTATTRRRVTQTITAEREPVRSTSAVTAVTKTTTGRQPVRGRDIAARPERVTVTPLERSGSVISRRPQAREAVSVSRRSDSVAVTAARDQDGRSSLTRRASGRHDRDETPQIVINNNNVVQVSGRQSSHRPRPYIPRRLYRDSHIRYDSHGYDHGSYFSFRWSSGSCGVALYLPLSGSRYHGSYYYSAGYPTTRYGLSYCYPRYHRKYVFVSLGGYWPHDYRYRRYYWYGCHPHYWYGARPVQSVTHNTYNTYNYYGSSSSGYSASAAPYYTLGRAKDDVVEVIDAPQYETPADQAFDQAVTFFETGRYDDAAEQFRQAVLLAPEDAVMPFTYAQALFAAGDFAHAAAVLRSALAQIPDDELTIYYPRGLYADEAVLTGQIEQLHHVLAREPFAADYQLLLGYQYLGMGQLEKATVYLPRAAAEPANRPAAEKLLALADQLRQEPIDNDNSHD